MSNQQTEAYRGADWIKSALKVENMSPFLLDGGTMSEEQARTLARLIEELLRDQQLIRVHSSYGQRPRVEFPCRFEKVYVDRRESQWFVSIGDTWGMVIAKAAKWEINVEQRAIWCERPDEQGNPIYNGWIRLHHDKKDGSWTAFRAAEQEFLAQPTFTDSMIPLLTEEKVI